ncbi:MAG: ABC transporter ATP-binding protein [Saprospiraceae bacterium]|nr:ABC transporter ATP-binding protein [Saprospiraceae bacterium]
MDIILDSLGKRFRYDWIFKNLNYSFHAGKMYGIKGPNGSGKSTLLKILSGHLSPSSGTVTYQKQGVEIQRNDLYKYLGYSGPYMDLIDELSMEESLKFHQKFKPFLEGLSVQEMISLLELKKAAQKKINHFSSGMQQRLKLGLALCSQSDLLFLDEPNTNLDQSANDWFEKLLTRFRGDRTIFIASNEPRDFKYCEEILNIQDFKK